MFIPNTLLQSPLIGLLIYLVFALVFIFVLYGIYLYSKSRAKNKLNKQAPQIYKVPDQMPNIKNTNTTAIKPKNGLNTKENIQKNRELHGKK